MSSVKIVSRRHGQAEIWIDDQKIKGVKSVRVELGVNCANCVTFEMTAQQVEFEGESLLQKETTSLDSTERTFEAVKPDDLVKAQ